MISRKGYLFAALLAATFIAIAYAMVALVIISEVVDKLVRLWH